MLALGLRLDDLGTRRLSWRDLLVIVHQSPEGSALSRALAGDSLTLTHRLLLTVEHRLRLLMWILGDGQGPAPEPIDLSAAIDEAAPEQLLSIDEVNARMGWSGVIR